ncbi:hypothetical protein [Shinella sumterensis]|uniref:hypothetical protein n=1 Tax=Shinella sumterensis TaxID=1967501 RepID=UPI0014312576|nr:hypothetical protein [Shinella sumterensis]MCD1264038.1 hypothetical protein [Shinella sumterensis]
MSLVNFLRTCGAAHGHLGGGTMMTYREFLGDAFFRDLEILNEVGAERILFFFDN